MDTTDELRQALCRLEEATRTAEGRLAGLRDEPDRDPGALGVLAADARRMRSELERLRREYAARVAAYLRC